MSIKKDGLPPNVKACELGETKIDNESHQSHDLAPLSTVEWSESEEKDVVGKLDRLIMPLLIVGFFGLQLDRGNIGNALTDSFLSDVGITQLQFNVGGQLLNLGIVLLELPSNLILYRVGPQKWISGQIICWGLVATFQAFQKGVGVFYATRLLLGLLEAGFIPAGLYILTQWYKRDETSRRFAAFFLGNMTAVASSGLIAYGILHMRGIAGLAGWQWLFLIEGMLTILIGVIFALLMPNSPEDPRNILGHSYFTSREMNIIVNRMAVHDLAKSPKSRYVKWPELKAAFSRWYIYPHLTVSFCTIAIVAPLSTYNPSIIASYGYDSLQANALASIGGWIVILLNLLFGWIADKTQRRGLLILVAVFLAWVFCLVTNSSRDLKYGILVCASIFIPLAHPLNGSWIAVNIISPAERSITMAILIMTANTAGIAGAQIFQAHDAPHYNTGFTVILALASMGLLFAVVSNLQYLWLNRNNLGKKEHSVDQQGHEEGMPHESGWRFSL